ncbi:Heavy metal-associated domain, HMA [Dillenia turbinata]|uniref:Heavy metal-associated domain, HMA n=1 Tax=Dillenia turbinata TaxID=194707 RepID=A0AAN8ZD59_9MAGN
MDCAFFLLILIKIDVEEILKVDLHCSKCYKKVKKVLCKFPEITDQVWDEKANTVTIKVSSCNPEKIRDKICCKGGKSIKCIKIVPPPPPTPPTKPPPSPPPKPETVHVSVSSVQVYLPIQPYPMGCSCIDCRYPYPAHRHHHVMTGIMCVIVVGGEAIVGQDALVKRILHHFTII